MNYQVQIKELSNIEMLSNALLTKFSLVLFAEMIFYRLMSNGKFLCSIWKQIFWNSIYFILIEMILIYLQMKSNI